MKPRRPPSRTDGFTLALDLMRAWTDRGAHPEDWGALFERAVSALNGSRSVEAMVGFDEALLTIKAKLYRDGAEKPDWPSGRAWAKLYLASQRLRDAAIKCGEANEAADAAAVLQYLANEFHLATNWRHSIERALRSHRAVTAGGLAAASRKRLSAAEWQKRIEPRARRMLAAGKTDHNIAGILFRDAERSPERVRKFVAALRRALPTPFKK